MQTLLALNIMQKQVILKTHDKYNSSPSFQLKLIIITLFYLNYAKKQAIKKEKHFDNIIIL